MLACMRMHQVLKTQITFLYRFLVHQFFTLLYCVTISANINNLYLVP